MNLICEEMGKLLQNDHSDRGKLGEYLVAIELLKNSWKVYFPLQYSYIDFIIKKDDKYKIIQVKTSKFKKPIN